MPPPQQYTPQYQAPPKRDGCMWAVILLAVLVPIIPLLTCGGCVVMSMISAAVDEDDGSGGADGSEEPIQVSEDPEDPEESFEHEAGFYAQKFVEQSLKAPSTAEFGRPEVTRLGPHAFEVRGAVDAENSFGAKLRNRYYVKLHYKPSTETWKLDEPVLLVEP